MYKKWDLGPLLGRKLYISLSRTGMPPDSELDKVLKRPSGAKTDQDDERTVPARPTAPSMVGPREQPLPPLLLFSSALGPWAKALKDFLSLPNVCKSRRMKKTLMLHTSMTRVS